MTDTTNTVQPPATQGGYQPQWSAWVRQFVTVALVIAIVYALTLLSPVINILLTTLLLALLLYVPARFIARRTPLNFAGGVVVLYLLLIVLIVFLVIAVIPGFLESANAFVKDLQGRIAQVRQFLMDYKAGQGQGALEVLTFRIDLDPVLQQLQALLVGAPTTAATPATSSGSFSPPFNLGDAITFATGMITSLVGGVTQFFTTVFLALFLSFLILLDLPNYQHRLLKSIPAMHHREMFLVIEKIRTVWNGFFRGQLTLGIVIGLLTWLQLTLMGVRQPVILAFVVALVSLIPTIGGIIALVPLGLVPLLQGSTVFTEMPNGTFALLVVGINLVISQILWNGVAPKIMGDAVALPLPVIILGIIVGTALGGALGAFLIVPILGTARVVVVYLIKKIIQQDPFPGEEAPAIVDLATL